LRAIAQYRNKTVAQVAINWCIAKGTIPIPGAKNLQQAQENIDAQNWQLDAGEVADLDRVAAGVDKPMVQNIFQTK
jgi:pyridoxine 4-dehydrogenase